VRLFWIRSPKPLGTEPNAATSQFLGVRLGRLARRTFFIKPCLLWLLISLLPAGTLAQTNPAAQAARQ
jgi:hypothetical protein